MVVWDIMVSGGLVTKRVLERMNQDDFYDSILNP